MNRVEEEIEKTEKWVGEQLAQGVLTQENVDRKSEVSSLDAEEFQFVQDLRQHLSSFGFTEEEIETVYGLVGDNPEHFNGQPAWTKVTLRGMFIRVSEIVSGEAFLKQLEALEAALKAAIADEAAAGADAAKEPLIDVPTDEANALGDAAAKAIEEAANKAA